MRLTVRYLRAHAGYALAAIATLALGVGATTAMFSAVYAVLLAPQPIRDVERLVVGWGLAPEIVRARGTHLSRRRGTRRRQPDRDADGRGRRLDVDGGARRPRRHGANRLHRGVGHVLRDRRRRGDPGSRPPARRRPAGRPERVGPSHAAWRDCFGGDPAIVGRTLRLDGEAQTVVGVMPPGFDYPRGAEYWRRWRPAWPPPRRSGRRTSWPMSASSSSSPGCATASAPRRPPPTCRRLADGSTRDGQHPRSGARWW